MEVTPVTPPESVSVENIKTQLTAPAPSGRRRAAEKFLFAAIGAIPWIGGFLAAAASIRDDVKAEQRDDLQTKWLDEHQGKIDALGSTLNEIEERFETLGPSVDERIQSEEYLALVRRSFQTWDQADTKEKRKYAANLITNAAGTRVCSDDVVRLFITWIELYHEAHFAIIREIFQNPGSTRYEIWTGIYGEPLPRDDSAEADLFKLIIRDLSTGSVIRQERDSNSLGQFVRKRPQRSVGRAPTTLETPFEGTKPYVLTELGKQFVHYTMNEVVARVSSGQIE